MSETFQFTKPGAINDATSGKVTPVSSASTTNTDTFIEISSIEGYSNFIAKHKKKGTYTRLAEDKTHAEIIDERTSNVIAVVVDEALNYIKSIS
ncbi:hypothetical protein QEN19_003751 [Hanseniaspora menglaensis]